MTTPTTTTPTRNREAWLNAAAAALTPSVEQAIGKTMPPLLIAAGFPSKRATGTGNIRIGECWSTLAADGTAHVFVSPLLADAVEVLAVLVHELIHAADNCTSGHKGAFRKAAIALGLEGKMTATTPGAELKARLAALAATLGEYPHAKLKPGIGIKKQTTRMLKLECPTCGMICRATRGALDEHGAPEHCGEAMVEA